MLPWVRAPNVLLDSTKGRQAEMDPTTAFQLAQYRMAELRAEAAEQRLAAEAGRGGQRRRGNRPALVADVLRSLPGRLRGIARIAAAEPDVPCP